MMTSSSDSISVAVRVRPAKHDSDVDEWIVQDQVIYAAQPECQHNVFAFDHILSQEKTNADVYEQVVQPIITSVMAGYHGTVFAYGQTSSGKTHTMMGNDHDPGVIKRAISQIFDEIHKETNREFLIRISYLEIYNEQIRDLLNNSSCANLQIKGPDMAVAGLTEQVTTDSEQILHYMTEGDKNRQVGCTSMNERSSRSHSIFRITIESSNRNPETNKRDGVRVSQLNLVDLAGSERATQTGATGTRLREGCHINTSLTALGIVIRKLSTGEKHINFRDSKLTRILQNSLGGNSRTAIICNISPSDYETSLSTLRFGADAKRIKNKPVINQVLTEDASLLQKRNKEIESLKALISKVETGKEQQLKEKDDTIDKLRKKIEGLQKLAISGELPPTVSDRNVATIPARRTDTRRRETWCPGQIAAAATPAKAAASAMVDTTGAQDDSFIAKYGIYKDNSGFFTPARPRKRRSDEAFPTTSKSDPLLGGDEADATAPDELEEARKEIQSLKEELEFLRNERGIYCGGACTPSAAKRARVDPSEAVTPTPALSLIREEESEMEDDSPFGRKLKIMATPVQKIQGMKVENRLLKRSLMAMSTCSTPAPSEDTVMTLCNRSAKPETCDVACQYEDSELGGGDADADFKIAKFSESLNVGTPRSDSLRVDSPARDTPLRTMQKLYKDSTPLIDFCSPREIRKTILTPARCSQASWLETENTPDILPMNVRDVETQVFFPEESPEVPKDSREMKDAETLTDPIIDAELAETRDETLGTPIEECTITPRYSSIPPVIVERSDAEAQTDPEPEGVEPEKLDVEVQVSAETSSCASQVETIQMIDADTSMRTNASEDASTQTEESKEPQAKVCTADGARGLDAILEDTLKSNSKKVVTRDVGVMARIEELWVIKMKLDQEKTAREEAESKLGEVWEERGKLVNTNDRYLEYFRAHGIDPNDILNAQGTAGSKVDFKNGGPKNEDVETLKRKYEALKEFCFRHPDIKDRMVNDKVLVRQKPSAKTQVQDVEEVENIEPTTAGERASIETPQPKPNERPLAELQDMQKFRGAKYLAEADPGECKPS